MVHTTILWQSLWCIWFYYIDSAYSTFYFLQKKKSGARTSRKAEKRIFRGSVRVSADELNTGGYILPRVHLFHQESGLIYPFIDHFNPACPV